MEISLSKIYILPISSHWAFRVVAPAWTHNVKCVDMADGLKSIFNPVWKGSRRRLKAEQE